LIAQPGPNPRGGITFVACIEAGLLEAMTSTLLASLRLFGGALAPSPFYAVVPRLGAPLQRRTRELLEALDCRLLSIRPSSAYTWYHFLNKAHAVAAVERLATTEFVAFLDSDLLVLQEPTDLLLGSDYDFAAVGERGSIESSRPDDYYGALWSGLTKTVGLRFDKLPLLRDDAASESTRLFWNSGVFVFRRSLPIGVRYRDCTTALLDARIASRDSGIHWFEQVSLGFAMLQAGLRWKALPRSYNFSVHGWGKGLAASAQDLEQVKLLHYHNALERPSFEILVARLDETHEEVARWLRGRGPIGDPSGLIGRTVSGFWRFLRRRQREQHLRGCISV
jgi:hypothetical protein